MDGAGVNKLQGLKNLIFLGCKTLKAKITIRRHLLLLNNVLVKSKKFYNHDNLSCTADVCF